MFKPNSGIWKPKPGDKFNLDDLLDIEIFFKHDLLSANTDYIRWKAFTEKYPKLTQSKKGFKGMLEVCKRGIFEAETNLKTVRELIKSI